MSQDPHHILSILRESLEAAEHAHLNQEILNPQAILQQISNGFGIPLNPPDQPSSNVHHGPMGAPPQPDHMNEDEAALRAENAPVPPNNLLAPEEQDINMADEGVDDDQIWSDQSVQIEEEEAKHGLEDEQIQAIILYSEPVNVDCNICCVTAIRRIRCSCTIQICTSCAFNVCISSRPSCPYCRQPLWVEDRYRALADQPDIDLFERKEYETLRDWVERGRVMKDPPIDHDNDEQPQPEQYLSSSLSNDAFNSLPSERDNHSDNSPASPIAHDNDAQAPDAKEREVKVQEDGLGHANANEMPQEDGDDSSSEEEDRNSRPAPEIIIISDTSSDEEEENSRLRRSKRKKSGPSGNTNLKRQRRF